MKIGIIGLGKMGEALAYRALKAGHEVIGFDPNKDTCNAAQKIGVEITDTLENVAQKARIIWLMVPHGPLIDTILKQLHPHLQSGDIIVDGGNSKYSDSMRRAKECASHNIFFVDCGTSGGIHGKEHGFCLMIGGDIDAFQTIEPILKSLASPHGYAHLGPSGAGHYVKMVHNGIEYGLLQAYAEGFHLLKDGHFKNQHLNLETIAALWNNGSVIRSWILSLVDDVMKEDQNLDDIVGKVDATGMGKWTVEEAHETHIPVPVIEKSLEVREWSQKTGGNYATKIVACLRNNFGGHAVTKK
jgi:6-phosphogluconate dehydrogenase